MRVVGLNKRRSLNAWPGLLWQQTAPEKVPGNSRACEPLLVGIFFLVLFLWALHSWLVWISWVQGSGSGFRVWFLGTAEASER